MTEEVAGGPVEELGTSPVPADQSPALDDTQPSNITRRVTVRYWLCAHYRVDKLYTDVLRLTWNGDGGQLGPPACWPPSPRPAQHHRQTFAVLVAPRATWMVLPGTLNS